MRTQPSAEFREGMQGALAPRRLTPYPIELPVLYLVPGPLPSPVGVGWSRTLSEAKAEVELGERLVPGTFLTVLLQTARGPLELQAQVVWTGKPPDAGGGILHGLVFTAADAKLLHVLRNLFNILNVYQDLSGTPRAGLRLPVAIPATCQAKYPPGPVLQGRTGNISREGLLLLLPEVLAPGMVLAVTLESPQGPVSLEGVVAWRDMSVRADLDELVQHGVQLTSRDWATAVALGRLVAELGKAPVPPREPAGLARTGAVE